nr:beta-agarase [uncultured bacterium]
MNYTGRAVGRFRRKRRGRLIEPSLPVYTLLFTCGITALNSYAKTLELISLKKGELHPRIDYSDSTIISNLENAIVVQTGGKDEWPNITFRPTGKPWDLRGFYTVKIDFTNMGSSPVYLGIRLDNPYEKKEDAPQHAQGFELFDPAETRTVSIRLSTEDWIFDRPMELVGMRRAPGTELMDLSNIDRIQVFAGHVKEPQTFLISNLRAEGEVKTVDGSNFLPFVDEFGQYKHDDWKGKIHSAADFAKAREAEEKELEKYPGVSNLGKFGGWEKGPKLRATGFFRVEKLDGQWWFVDPEGLLFWSNGPTCISPDFGYTGVQGREAYFENLPKENEPLGRFYELSDWAPHGFYADKVPFKIQQTYKANLFRKYGEQWPEQFAETAHKRLKSWGMNTIANWAAPEVYLKQRTPYCANFFIRGNRMLEGSHGYWGKFHDVFDPSFREAIQRELAARPKEANDPWCLGFFVDNEISWGYDGKSIAFETLASPADQPAKIEFVADLKAKYGDIEKLNRAWGSNHTSWEALLETRELPDEVRAGEDLQAFYAKTADTYFRTVREELKKAAPNHLYLGCRFAWVNDLVALAAAEHCDVVSYNKYTHSVRHLRLPAFIDRPLMIGEYHFGSTERGHFHPGLREADNQEQRAEKFTAYLNSALDNPHIVGVHWFQYVDEHIAGRADGENYNVGLVDVCDTPYPEMVEAIRESAKTLYEYRRGKAR